MIELYILGVILTLCIRGYLAYGKDFQYRGTRDIDGDKVFGYLMASIALSVSWCIIIFPAIGFLIAKYKGKKS